MPSRIIELRAWLAVALLVCCAHSLAKDPGIPTLPSTMTAHEPVGIVFPGFTVAGAVNPAALSRYEKATAIQEAFSPGLGEGDPSGAFAALAASNKKFGINFGYRGPSLSGGNTHGLYMGGGYQFPTFAFGISLRDTDVQGGFAPAFDVGFLLGKNDGVNAGLVIYALDVQPQVAVGVGYRKPKKFHYDITLVFPPFAHLSSGMTMLTGSVTVNSGIFAFYIRSTFATQITGFSHTLGLLAWVTPNFNLFTQFTTPRTLTFGTTLVF